MAVFQATAEGRKEGKVCRKLTWCLTSWLLGTSKCYESTLICTACVCILHCWAWLWNLLCTTFQQQSTSKSRFSKTNLLLLQTYSKWLQSGICQQKGRLSLPSYCGSAWGTGDTRTEWLSVSIWTAMHWQSVQVLKSPPHKPFPLIWTMGTVGYFRSTLGKMTTHKCFILRNMLHISLWTFLRCPPSMDISPTLQTSNCLKWSNILPTVIRECYTLRFMREW